MEDPPTVTILLLGDPECGKSTFLSRRIRHPHPDIHPTPPLLHDLDQPFAYNIRLYNRPYRFEFHDTSSPASYTLLAPNVVILCYDISDRRTLVNAQCVWRREVGRRDGGEVPVMLLGLKRDLRREEAGVIYPQEGVRVAQEMQCDRYAECSAVTGELVREVFEDIAMVAAKTTTEDGGLTPGGCWVM